MAVESSSVQSSCSRRRSAHPLTSLASRELAMRAQRRQRHRSWSGASMLRHAACRQLARASSPACTTSQTTEPSAQPAQHVFEVLATTTSAWPPATGLTPSSRTQLIGTRYFRQVIITWSMRSRGSVQRTHIITKTSSQPLRMKTTTLMTLPRTAAQLPKRRRACEVAQVVRQQPGVPAAEEQQDGDAADGEHGCRTRP